MSATTKNTGKFYHISFQSCGDMVRRCEEIMSGASEDLKEVCTKNASSDWAVSWEASQEMARTGDKTGAASIREAARRLSRYFPRMGVVDMWEHGDEGLSIDLARFNAGEVECWVRPDTAQLSYGKGRVITLSVDSCAACGVGASDMARRGAAICAVVEALELSGFSVGVFARSIIGCGRDRYMLVEVEVKRAGEPINAGTLAYTLANSGFIRRQEFALSGHELPDIIHNGMGRVLNRNSYSECEPLSEVLSRADYHIEGVTTCELWQSLGHQGDKGAAAFALAIASRIKRLGLRELSPSEALAKLEKGLALSAA